MFAYEDKFEVLASEINKIKGMLNSFQKKVVADLKASETQNVLTKADLDAHVEEYKASYLQIAFQQDRNDSAVKNILQKCENLRAHLDGKVEQLNFELSTKLRIDDMKQNFKQLNDILFIKFQQIEDTKEAVRNLISYQKFFHPIQTQQLISENLLQVKVIRDDERYLEH